MDDGLHQPGRSPTPEDSPRSSFVDDVEIQPLAKPQTARKVAQAPARVYARDVLALCFFVLCAIAALYSSLSQGIPNLIFWKTSHGGGAKTIGIILSPDKHTGRDAHNISLQWNITSSIREPDGVKKRVLLVNGKEPACYQEYYVWLTD